MQWPRSFVVGCAGLVLFGGLASTAVPLGAQNPAPAASPTFEVASVKPNRSGEPFVRFGLQPGGRFNAQNVPARELIRFAFNVQPFQIEGGPGWLNSDRFDVTAKAEGDIPPVGPGQSGPVQVMMQNLLAERFKLKVHRENKEMPIYELKLARSDGRLGRQIEPSTTDCAALRGRGAGPGGRGPGGPPPAPPQPGERPQCGMFMGIASVGAGDVEISQLAQLLSQRVQRIVVDRTGLTGRYSFNLEFTPDQMPPPGAVAPGIQLPPINPDGPSIFTALQEQLGLRLESARGPVETLVIDNVEQPTPD